MLIWKQVLRVPDAGWPLGQQRRHRRPCDLPCVTGSDYVNGQVIYVDGGMTVVL